MRVTLEPVRKEEPGSLVILARFYNTSSNPNVRVDNLNLQVAVSKTQKLTIKALSKTSISHGESSSQELKVSGKPGGSLKFRLRVLYKNVMIGGNQEQDVVDQIDFAKFPAGLL